MMTATDVLLYSVEFQLLSSIGVFMQNDKHANKYNSEKQSSSLHSFHV